MKGMPSGDAVALLAFVRNRFGGYAKLLAG